MITPAQREEALQALSEAGAPQEPISVLVMAYIELLAAIVDHRDQRGDDRCWLDDSRLYVAAGIAPADNRLPPKGKFLENCSRYYDNRCANANWLSYQELQSENASLKAEVKRLQEYEWMYKDLQH